MSKVCASIGDFKHVLICQDNSLLTKVGVPVYQGYRLSTELIHIASTIKAIPLYRSIPLKKTYKIFKPKMKISQEQ